MRNILLILVIMISSSPQNAWLETPRLISSAGTYWDGEGEFFVLNTFGWIDLDMLSGSGEFLGLLGHFSPNENVAIITGFPPA